MATKKQYEGVRGVIKNHSNDIDKYSQQIAELGRRRNALLPVSHLPDSVLAEIFQFYKELHPDPSRRVVILKLTQVCHSWRVTASSYGVLWADMYAVRAEQVQFWLESAQRCPLDITTREFYSNIQTVRGRESDALCLVLEEISRIRALEIFGPCLTKDHLSTSRWIDYPASLLRSLHIQAPEYTYLEDIDDSFCLSEVLLRRELPCLTSLMIGDCRFRSNNTIFPPSLKNLDISRLDPTADWDPHMVSVILTILGTLPSLESLQLYWDSRQNFQSEVPALAGQVTLPQLQKLRLVSWSQPRIAELLLSHVMIPASSRIVLDARLHDQFERNSFMEVVAAKLNGQGLIDNKRPIGVFFIDGDADKIADSPTSWHLNMGGWATQSASQSLYSRIHDGSETADFYIELSLDREDPEEVALGHRGQVISATCSMLPLSDVAALALRNVCLDLQLPSLIAISRAMPGLIILNIEGWSNRGRWPPCLFREAGDFTDLFPRVGRINLKDMPFYEETTGFWQFLQAYLAFRQERGTRVETLQLGGCNDLAPDYRENLQSLVAKLIWEPTEMRSGMRSGTVPILFTGGANWIPAW